MSTRAGSQVSTHLSLRDAACNSARCCPEQEAHAVWTRDPHPLDSPVKAKGKLLIVLTQTEAPNDANS